MSRALRLLCVTPFYAPAWHLGGIVRSVSQLCRGLAALGLDVTVYTTDSGRDQRLDVPVDRRVDSDGVRVTYFRAEALAWPYSRSLAAACRKTIPAFDLVYVVSLWNHPGIPARAAAVRYGVPYVESFRGSMAPATLRRARLRKWLYLKVLVFPVLRRAAAIHYTTPLERTWTRDLRLDVPSFVVPNGLDLSEFDGLPDRPAARQALGLGGDELVVTYLGRLDARKGLDVLVEAFALVAPVCPQSRLLLAGPDDGFGGTLRRMVARYRLGEYVRFLGFVNPERRHELLAASDVFALVAREGENFGNAAVEAMAAGVPVVVSNEVGVSKDVQAAEAGHVVPVEVGRIAAALRCLLGDAAQRRAMGERARCAVRARYGIETVARQMAAACEDVVSGRRSAGLGWSDDGA
ncbi:MAG: glycosyltransferase [Chloroflexi bacterium]|nr:glycosyltransferase [Chloroflexota bacterium]